MVPIKSGKYEYRPESLVEIRKNLGLKQTEMARLLSIPANTLWRWETGATKPDAESLAAIYSLAMDHKVTPRFFQKRRVMPKPTKQRSRLIVIWDFQNVQFSSAQLERINVLIEDELDRRFRSTSNQLFKAFASPSQSNATDKLQDLGWRVWEDHSDMDDEIIKHASSDCGQAPKDTIFVLVTKDGDFVELIGDLKDQGVLVYLMTLSNSMGIFSGILGYSECNEALVREVGQKNWIKVSV